MGKMYCLYYACELLQDTADLCICISSSLKWVLKHEIHIIKVMTTMK